MDIREFCAKVSKLDINFEGHHWFKGIAEDARLANSLFTKTQRESKAVARGMYVLLVALFLYAAFDIDVTYHRLDYLPVISGFCLYCVALGIAMRLACVRRDKIAGLTLDEILTNLEALSLLVGEPVEKMVTMSSEEIVTSIKETLSRLAHKVHSSERLLKHDPRRSGGDYEAIVCFADEFAKAKVSANTRIDQVLGQLCSVGCIKESDMAELKKGIFSLAKQNYPVMFRS